ncbi:type II toxin-antitoxin system VapB family antitoxin [Streptosporangium sp. NBC_01639]|uniref:type II toxin-antitoxin system VapB family antitoxin n=1 Tax=unclassified Streptosporangium TaxID=2632669 RepID=UPI002DDB35AB|nr:type II toxin-antitoxin system VapB family antitoxin [Streptosporangium sp. NBC_01756]WSC89769.1 type II toxin-antitoxin system VapB family antitoxin [Streptosporangium sp. NBC_01756]WTD51604.1 type II toxin-antitoxin system VapB family antitoxin [Streptosporangium sp. NBC_01639]
MGKILVDVDEEMLAAAQAIFGTKTKKDTVNLALAEVVARVSRLKALEEGVELFASGEFDSLLDKRNYRTVPEGHDPIPSKEEVSEEGRCAA